MTLIQIDAALAERVRLRAEKEAARKWRDRSNWPSSNKAHHEPGRQDGKIPYSEYPFVFWDGEAPQDTGYSLFGSSMGDEICHPHLTTIECFDLLLESKERDPDTIHTIFGGRYDFDEICRQSMPLDRLSRLKYSGHCTWHGYEIKQAEGKFFKLRKYGTSTTIFETFGWFKKKYVRALRDYQIGTDEELEFLESEKNKRSEFLWADIDEIRQYMRLELKLGPILMDAIRKICHTAGFNPRNWYGPSALALEALSKNKVREYFGNTPEVVKTASQHGYIGGRFEPVRGGILFPIYSYDKNSAYMAAALELPCLAHGEWRRGTEYESEKFGIYHIRYSGGQASHGNPSYVHPLPMRHKDGSVNWPARVEGWYWSPEAELVKDSPYATFIEAYIFDSHCQHRPFDFVRDWFHKRLVLKRLPPTNPSRRGEKAFKWALASIYGQLARTVGWDRFRKQPPKYHNLEWAGYITSRCRADMWKLAQQAGDKLISIDTDSVTAMCPLVVDEGPELGQWEETRADLGVFFQSGVFALQVDDEWIERKTRGVEEDIRTRRVPVSPEMMISAIKDEKAIELKPRTRYVSIRMALNHQLGSMGEWRTHPGDKLVFGGNGKRVHNQATCYRHNDGRENVCLSSDSHTFSPRPTFTYSDYRAGGIPKSQPHLLPWKDDCTGKLDVNLIADILWVDPEKIDEDDEWIRSLIREQT